MPVSCCRSNAEARSEIKLHPVLVLVKVLPFVIRIDRRRTPALLAVLGCESEVIRHPLPAGDKGAVDEGEMVDAQHIDLNITEAVADFSRRTIGEPGDDVPKFGDFVAFTPGPDAWEGSIE